MENFHPGALANCLATRERDSFQLAVGVSPPGECGEAPFSTFYPSFSVLRWPWTEWPLFDRVLFEQDLRRIERWFAARGHFEAEVTGITVTPESARDRDVLEPGDADPGCERAGEDEGCTVDIVIDVSEGAPTRVGEIEIEFDDGVPQALKRSVVEAMQLHQGDRFDETVFDNSKAAMEDVLADASFARAEVSGFAYVNRPERTARLRFEVHPGPPCVFGEVEVTGTDDLPVSTIRSVAAIEAGQRYSPTELLSAQRAVFALGAFSSVTATPQLPERGNVVDVLISVEPAQVSRFSLGAGVQGGIIELRGGFEQQSVPQWDVHGLATYRHRNFLGGLRQLRLEERPRMIVLEAFPSFERPRFGNQFSVSVDQPNFFEPRTHLVADAVWDYGPDPYDFFFRHRIDTVIRAERPFLSDTLFVSAGVGNSLYFVPTGEELPDATALPADDGGAPSTYACEVFSDQVSSRCVERELPSDFHLTYLEQRLRLDLRDEAARPHAGFFAQVSVQEAGFLLPSSWDSVRVLPEARFYLPLPGRMTIAGRFALGMIFITRADDTLSRLSQDLGPRDFRLRGGGASSNRGFQPGDLGDGPQGGTRRWEASLEFRIPLTEEFEIAAFTDAGDVSRNAEFRFDMLQLSVGGGLRYYTVLGAVRLDLAFRVPGAQFLSGDRRNPGVVLRDARLPLLLVTGPEWPGAVHITLGNPF